jgi:predicted alpha-1,2-mannosidase
MRIIHLFFFILLLAGCRVLQVNNFDNEPVVLQTCIDLADPLVGTGGHGHTYPGATVPFGMVQLSPDTRLDGWDGCGGYHYSDSIVYGFSHTHLQGTGVSDYGDILFMPTNGKTTPSAKWRDSYKSKFSHTAEDAHPGYYGVVLKNYGIMAELTATEHTGIHKYTMAQGDTCRLFIDMMHRDNLLYYDFQTIGDTVIYGYRVSKAWAEEQHTYFYAVFSRPFIKVDQLMERTESTDSLGQRQINYEEMQQFAVLFPPADTNQLMIKVGISGVDCYGAQHNLWKEAPHWDFYQYVVNADQTWRKQLEKLPCPDLEPNPGVYYSSLYHCFTTPNVWSDVDGRYRGMDKIVHTDTVHKHYTVFSLWDTFRALHPLLTKVEPERTGDFIASFIAMYEQSGRLPVWELAGNETNCMIGYHSAPVIMEAYAQGLRNFDAEKALEAMVVSANATQELNDYEKYGYVPAENYSESVSKTLEYAFDDWCVAGLAKMLNHQDIYERFIVRCQNWKNVYDPETDFFRPRRNGGFPEPFDPFQVDFNFTEANAWQYRFFVPHDMQTLIRYHGGKEKFRKNLDDMFSVSSQTTGREQADITGLIGQYAHGNEPSHHVATLYNYTDGNSIRSAQLFDKIKREQYQFTPDGLCGNEDCGQMSAWYVLAAHEVYSTVPGIGRFMMIDSIPEVLDPELNSVKRRKGPRHLNDLPPRYPNSFTSTSQFPNAAVIVASPVTEKVIVPLPIIKGPQTSFENEATIRIYHVDTLMTFETFFVTESGETIDMRNSTSFKIKESGIVRCVAIHLNGKTSEQVTAKFTKRISETKIKLDSQYNNQYTGGSYDALVDGMRGGTDFRTGAWQGYQGQPVIANIDLGKNIPINSIALSCLQETKSWIWYPVKIEYYISTDGVKFESVGTATEEISKSETPSVKEFTVKTKASARYIKVVATPMESIPLWHLGAGGKPWIFADEIIIK